MDQRTGDIEQDVKEIHQTRAALTKKLEQLEERVHETVEEARTTVLDIVENVKGSAEDFVDKTKQKLDPGYQLEQHPLLVFGGAVLLGYVLGLLETRRPWEIRRPAAGFSEYFGRPASAEIPTAQAPPRQGNIWDDLLRPFQEELDVVKGAVLETGRTFIREFFHRAIPAMFEVLETGKDRESRRDGRSAWSPGDQSFSGHP